MGRNNFNIATLIGSRICHDLISPIGAIDNGLELLAMSGAATGPEIDLITESVGNASARIRLFRIAFGAAGEQMVGRAEVVSILRDVYGRGRLDPVWTPRDPQSRTLVRMSFLALMCLESAMPYGGQVEISETGGVWQVRGQADKLNIDADLWSVLSGHDPVKPVQPSQVQFALLHALAIENRRKLRVDMEEHTVSIRF